VAGNGMPTYLIALTIKPNANRVGVNDFIFQRLNKSGALLLWESPEKQSSGAFSPARLARLQLSQLIKSTKFRYHWVSFCQPPKG